MACLELKGIGQRIGLKVRGKRPSGLASQSSGLCRPGLRLRWWWWWGYLARRLRRQPIRMSIATLSGATASKTLAASQKVANHCIAEKLGFCSIVHVVATILQLPHAPRTMS